MNSEQTVLRKERNKMRALCANTLLVAVALIVVSSPVFAIPTNIEDYECSKLKDFTATMTVVKVNENELAKINRDAILLYRFKTVNVKYKEPNMIRIEGEREGTRATFVMNGPYQYVSIPKLHMVTRRDFGDSPGKRKSLMDLGLISPYYMTYTNATFMRFGSVDGVQCAVFNMTYKDRNEDTSHHIVYIDPKTKVVLRRESYSQEGQLQAIYFYKNIKEVAPGIWMPTQVVAQTTDRKIAAITDYKNIKVNTDLPDSLFKL